MLEPWNVINSQGDGPFAIKTLLGWVLSGSHENWKYKDKNNCQVANVNRVAVEHGKLLLEKHSEHDYIGKAAEDKPEMSRENLKPTELMEQSVNVKNAQVHLRGIQFCQEDGDVVQSEGNLCS